MSQEPDRDLSALYRAGADEEPPAWLDRRIEASARKDLRRSGLRNFFALLPRWRLAVGAFAVVTLSVSLVTLMKDEAPSILDPTAATTPSAEPRPRDPEMRPPSEVPRSEAVERARVQEQAPAAADKAAKASGQEKKEERADRRAPADAVGTEAAPVAKPDAADLPKLAEAQIQAAPRPSAELPAAPAASAPPPATRDEEVRQRSNVEGATAFGRLARKEAPPARAAASPSVTEESPQAWAKRLSEWLAQGREQEVRQELERFRQRYPDFVLPEDLRRLLAQAPPSTAPTRPDDRDPLRPAP